MPRPPEKHPTVTFSHSVVLLSAVTAFFIVVSYTANPLRKSLPLHVSYLSHFSKHPHTHRIGCREYDAGAQSCVFSGLACINTSSALTFSRPTVYLLEDDKEDGEKVLSDDWCKLRYQSSDPRYFSSRHWPIKPDTFAPQRSCLNAWYRTKDSVPLENVRWVDNMWLVDLDNVRNDHNNHLLKDILWMLDVLLWQSSIDVRSEEGQVNPLSLFDSSNRHIYLPQGKDDWITQTARDVNRLTYSLVLQLDTGRLYPNYTHDELQSPVGNTKARNAAPLLEAFPELEQSLLFHRDLLAENGTDMVCTPRLTVGAKIGNGAHERVCRHLREKAYELFGIRRPMMRRLGRIFYPQPPKRVTILQRHKTRKLGNVEEIETAVREAFGKYGVAVEVIDTSNLETAEAQVRMFSRAGVVITPHGSQAMGQLFMQRHSSLIEIMPVGYTDYAFNLLADSCRIWYYELQGVLGAGDRRSLEKECGDKTPHMMNPCVKVKFRDVWADVAEVVKTVRFALERMGHVAGDWLER